MVARGGLRTIRKPSGIPLGPLGDPPLGGPSGAGSGRKHGTCSAKAQNFVMQKTKLCNATNTTLHCNKKTLCCKILHSEPPNFAMQQTKRCNARNPNPQSCILPSKCTTGQKVCSAIKKTLRCKKNNIALQCLVSAAFFSGASYVSRYTFLQNNHLQR
jgi:hypothetical protein